MRKGNKNLPRTSTCEDFLASTIAISGVRCYTVMTGVIVLCVSREGMYMKDFSPEDKGLIVRSVIKV